MPVRVALLKLGQQRLSEVLAIVPAASVPVPPQLGGRRRNGNHVTNARRNLAVAPWADVCLRCVVGLDEANLGIRIGREVQAPSIRLQRCRVVPLNFACFLSRQPCLPPFALGLLPRRLLEVGGLLARPRGLLGLAFAGRVSLGAPVCHQPRKAHANSPTAIRDRAAT